MENTQALPFPLHPTVQMFVEPVKQEMQKLFPALNTEETSTITQQALLMAQEHMRDNRNDMDTAAQALETSINGAAARLEMGEEQKDQVGMAAAGFSLVLTQLEDNPLITQEEVSESVKEATKQIQISVLD